MADRTFNDVKINLTLKPQTTRSNLSSNKEDLAVQMGKIQKWYTDFAWSAWLAPTVEVSGSGNAVTTASWSTSTGKLTLTKGSTFLTSATQYIKEIAQSGSGNAVTSLSVSGGKLTYTLGSTFLTEHPDITKQTDTTSTATPSFGGTFTAVDSVTRDSNGHVLKINTKTITVPNKTMGAASASAAGSIGLVPAPAAGKQTSFLRGDGTWVVPTNTTYTAGTGLALSGTTFNHSNSVTARTDYMQPYVKYDAQGHITGSSYWMADAKGTDGTAGWIKVATIKHLIKYDNTPFLLDISQRGNTISYRIHIRWNNDNSVDPSLGEFLIASDHAWEAIRPRAYIIKSATSTWDLYILKLDSYEAIAMRLQPGRYFDDHTEWTWKDEQTAESAITGGTEATKKVYSTTDHTHDSLTSKVLTKSTLDGTAGNFFFKGDNLLGNVNDWVGIQADAGNDKFQLVANGTSLMYRQNDTGGTNSTNWREWVGLLAPDRVTTDTYLSAEATTSTLGTGTTAFTYNSGVKISHKAYTAYSSGLYKITVDAAGHVSAATALTITPTPSSKTHTNWDTTAERAYLVTKGWMSYWNGAYNSRNGSNLTYCNRGAFGTIVTKSDTDYVPFKTVTGTPDMNDYMNEDGWIKWNTNAGTNVPVSNWGILLTKTLPNIQVFIPDNATGIYFRRKANATSDPTEWWGLTGSAGNTYDLNSLKYAFVYDSTSDFASYAWHKFAEVTVTDANADATATFLVSKTWGNTPLVTGILSAHIRTASTKVFDSAQFRWMITNGEGGINPDEFVMVYTNTASKSCKVELWHKQTAQYDGWVFKLLKEHSRVSYSQYPWTLFEQNGHGSATYTAGTGKIVSKLNSIANPALSADKINTDAGDFQTPVYFSNGVPVAVNIAAPSAYFGTVPRVRQSDGVMAIGRYIDFHATNASTNNYDVRLDASSTNMVTMNSASGSTTLRIAGTLPMLRFQQTTSGKAYDNTSCGIWCRPADTNGVNMFMQSGGCIMIGAGEFASGAYSRKDSTGTTQTGYDNIANSTAERLYLGADGEVHIISNGQNIATYSNNDHRVWKFNTSGQLITPGFIADTLDLQHTMLRQNLRSVPNCVTLAEWIVDGAASTTYKPGISFYNTGGDSTDKGAIILRPYHHNTDPWASGHPVGLYIGKNMLSLDGVNVALQNATSLNTMINALGTGSSTPVDADYYVSQYAGGGTTTTTYHRRPVSALYSYIRSKHIKSAIAVQTGSSKKAKITLQTLMTWLITTKKYIPSGTTEDIIIKTTWAYANNDILRFNANGVDYEMSLAGVIIEFKGFATSYNTGEFTFTITSAPAVLSDAPTSGYTRFPANTTAVYHCNGSSYNPTWTVNMNKAVQTLLYSSTSSAGYGYADIVIGSVFSNWTLLLLEFMEASYGYSNENPHSGSGLIPLSLVRSIGNVSNISQQYQIPIGYNPGNTTANQYISVVYTDESTFRLSRGGSGGPLGKIKIYGIC